MYNLKQKLCLASLLLSCGLLAQAVQAQAVQAQTTATHKPAGRAAAKPAKVAPAADKDKDKDGATDDDDEDNKTPDTAGSEVTEFNCDHGQKITLYRNPGDEKFIAMRWQKHIMRMRRVATSTGAERFENRRHGMLWIGIPAKSMLLDSKKGQQLANECRNAEQAQAHEKK